MHYPLTSLFLVGILAIACSCGGGGSSSSATPTPAGPTTSSPEGIYTGTLKDGTFGSLTATAIANASGQTYLVTSATATASKGLGYAFTAAISLSAGNGTGFIGTQALAMTLSNVQVTTGASISASYSVPSTGDTGTIALTYNNAYASPQPLASLKGSYWSSSSSDNITQDLVLDGAGNITGSGTGSLTLADPTKNLYQVKIAYAKTGTRFSGFGFWSGSAPTGGLAANSLYVIMADGASYGLAATYLAQPPSTQGSGIALNYSTTLPANAITYYQGSYQEAFRFTCPQAITVTQVGYYDSNLVSQTTSGYAAETFNPAQVGIWDLTTNALLGWTTVQPTDAATTIFRYHALTTPLVLNTTDTYACVAATSGNNYVAYYTYNGEISSALTWVGFDGFGQDNLSDPTGLGPGGNNLPEPNDPWVSSSTVQGNIGANFMFTVN